MTQPELTEWNVCYQTRIGTLCGASDPDAVQREIAEREADEHIARLREAGEFSVEQ